MFVFPFNRKFSIVVLLISFALFFMQQQSQANFINQMVFNNAAYKPIYKQDSLYFKRSFLKMPIYKDGKKLANFEVLEELIKVPKLKSEFNWGFFLRPAALLVSAGGIVMSNKALKGITKNEIVVGKTYEYKERSLPKFLGGVGLLIAGGCLFEFGNDIKSKAIEKYNKKMNNQKRFSLVNQIKFGVSQDGSIGLFLSY